MKADEMKMLFGVIDEIEEEYHNFNLYRKEKEKEQISLAEYLLYRQHALDLIRMENSNAGDLFTIPNVSI